ncbi:hypothetical protein GWI33_005308 [Rhynchophorus ferrugineus]|uniref:Uncharacterized protein n=1 Tax=Rhynchophorus ferrugineus TaxID=354439 RepID=A0A834MDY0_RHYFE|nr:hypothetical protein GWI33_005308 [Rhynchophorus ferrugineus]
MLSALSRREVSLQQPTYFFNFFPPKVENNDKILIDNDSDISKAIYTQGHFVGQLASDQQDNKTINFDMKNEEIGTPNSETYSGSYTHACYINAQE